VEFERLDRLLCDDVVLYITFVALFLDGRALPLDVGMGHATQRRGLVGGQDAMQALASYAKQSKDEGLYKVASRILRRELSGDA
jgi:hypothetical protein